jgi:hypothetical protein
MKPSPVCRAPKHTCCVKGVLQMDYTVTLDHTMTLTALEDCVHVDPNHHTVASCIHLFVYCIALLRFCNLHANPMPCTPSVSPETDGDHEGESQYSMGPIKIPTYQPFTCQLHAVSNDVCDGVGFSSHVSRCLFLRLIK